MPKNLETNPEAERKNGEVVGFNDDAIDPATALTVSLKRQPSRKPRVFRKL
jgi:hypothetical protein